MYLLSICIPCNGRVDILRRTLDSIYHLNNDVNQDDFEVVITDNDPAHSVCRLIHEYPFDNLRYIPTECEGFMNSYYALLNGQGKLLKLHNSQNLIIKGALSVLLKNMKSSLADKPLIFHTNGFLNEGRIFTYNDFSSFMMNLSYWSSWSGGMTIWKEDFDKISNIELNPLFPHTSVFLTQFSKLQFVIDDNIYYEVQRVPKRGGHNKFEAFTKYYPNLILESYKKGYITEACKDLIIKKLYHEYIPTLLFNKYLARIETFDARGFRFNCKLYFPKYAFLIAWLNVALVPFRMVRRRISTYNLRKANYENSIC
jgi:hypothetical protein